jgi:hypothetical protein
MNVLTVNLLFSTLVFWIAARLYLLPRLDECVALATVYDAPPFMGPAYWIPAFWVPALLVTHTITFIVLGKQWTHA